MSAINASINNGSSVVNLKDNESTLSKIFSSTAAKRLNLLKGYEGVWITLRRENKWYITNKILSICISLLFATLTLNFKKTTIEYQHEINSLNLTEPDNTTFHIRLIYWFMFIYYSLHGMDEMIELFSVINQLEKGALGLFFELNYLIGVFNACHCIFFANKYSLHNFTAPDGASAEDIASLAEKNLRFNRLENFVRYQYYYSFVCFIMAFLVWGVYRQMNVKASQLSVDTKKNVVEDEKAANNDKYKKQE